MMKTFIQFFTVPFLVYFLLKLSAVILRGVTSALSSTGNTTLGRIVFMIASLDAAKEAAYNISTAAGGITLGTTAADEVRYPFYVIGADGVSARDYGDIKKVAEYFDLASFDYLIGFIAAAFLLFTIGVCLIVFVQRIFELVLLYLVSPYFVCMIPLDDGEKFSRWREMFVAKCFTGFGSAIGMRMFLMVCPMVMGNQIRFGTAVSPEMDYMMKLFFLAGGAWAVFKSGSLITSLLSYQAGMSEANTAAIASGVLYSYTAGAVINKGRQAIGSAFSGRGHGGHGGAGAGEEGGAGGGGSRFADVPAEDPVKQKYTGFKGLVARHAMGSGFVNKQVNRALKTPLKAVSSLSGVNRKIGKAAGYASSFSGWISTRGKGKTPEGRNRLQRAAANFSQKTGNISMSANDRVARLNRIGRRLEDVQNASHSKWGLLSMTVGQDGDAGQRFTQEPQRLDVQIGPHSALNSGSTIGVDKEGNVSSWQFGSKNGDYKMASGSGQSVAKAEGTVAGSSVKYSDISIKGLNVSGAASRHTISGGSSGSAGGSQRPVSRRTVSGVNVRLDRREWK